METEKHDKIEAEKNRKEFQEEVRRRTTNYALSNEVFDGVRVKKPKITDKWKIGDKCQLSEQFGISNENSLQIFVRAGLIYVDPTRKGEHGTKYIKWIRPFNESIEIVNALYMPPLRAVGALREKRRKAKLAKKSQITEKVNPSENMEELNKTKTPATNIMTKEEFTESIYSDMRNAGDNLFGRIEEALNEIYKQRKTSSKTIRTALIVEVKENGVFVKKSAAKLHKKAISFLTSPILQEVGFFDENYNCICQPTDEIVEAIIIAGRYKKYVDEIRREIANAVVEVPAVEEDKPKTNFPSSVEISKETGIMDDYLTLEQFSKLSTREQSELMYKRHYEEVYNRRITEIEKSKVESERSKNKHEEFLLLEKIIRNNIIGE